MSVDNISSFPEMEESSSPSSSRNSDSDNNDQRDSEELMEPSKVAYLSVVENVVFCIDKIVLNEETTIYLQKLLCHFQKTKALISVKPVKFYYLLYGKDAILLEDKGEGTLPKITDETEETESCDLGLIFKTLAANFHLPDERFYSSERPPPFVLHAVLIFGRNQYLPKLTDVNSFFFYAKNNFFNLDILYLNDGSDKNQCQKISKALQNFRNYCSGYYHEVEKTNYVEIQGMLSEFLGHPLIRYPQNEANFRIDVGE